jgi:hypothetical protein
MTTRPIPLLSLIRLALLTVGLHLASATAAFAQVRSDDGLSGRLDPKTAAAVRTVIETATAQGVPGEPLAAKALEGQSKGATGERIVLAVRNLAIDLTAARTALGATASSAEIVAGAGALRAGASGEVLSQLKAARGTRSAILPLATLTDLVARGVPVADAVQTVLGLASRKASEADYRTKGMTAGAPAGTAPAPVIPRIVVPPAPGAQPPVEPPSPISR